MSLNKPYREISELPETIPPFPLGSVVLLPGNHLPLNIFEPRYLQMTDDSLRSNRLIGIIQPTQAQTSDAMSSELELVGCVGRITQFAESGDGRYAITLTGVARFRILHEMNTTTAYRNWRVTYDNYIDDLRQEPLISGTGREELLRMLRMFEQSRGLTIDKSTIEGATDANLINALSMQMQFKPKEKQALLEAIDVRARADILIAIAELEMAESSGAPIRLQ